MHRFYVGDTVRCLETLKEGFIVSIEDDDAIEVSFPGWDGGHWGSSIDAGAVVLDRWFYSNDELVLAEASQKGQEGLWGFPAGYVAPHIFEAFPESPEVTESALDFQVGGDHYRNLKIQPVLYIIANQIPYCEANIIKYATRWRAKGGIKDLKKIIQYAEILIEEELANPSL